MRIRYGLLLLAVSCAESVAPPVVRTPELRAPYPLWVNDLVGQRKSPAAFLPEHVVLPSGEPIPYAIVSDSRIVAQGDVAGLVAARTVVFAPESVDSVWRSVDVLGETHVPIARMGYRLVFVRDTAHIQAVFCGLQVSPCVSQTWKD